MKKILIITSGVCIGGAEVFAVNISRFAPRDEFSFDYLVFEGYSQDFAPEIRARGDRVITVSSPHDGYSEYIKTLGKLIDENQYDVVHSHTQFNSGLNMMVAKKHHVPVRIAHSHTTAHENKESFKQRAYESVMRSLIKNCATDLCACGVEAGRWGFGKNDFIVINNGIDTKRFRFDEGNRRRIRKKYSVPDDATLVGHCGTLSEVKNQEHIIRNLPSNAYLMCVGRSPGGYGDFLRSVSKECGNEDRVILTGPIMNVEEYLSAFDVLAFPSLREGTPLALLEAQANGLPCVISQYVPEDVILTDLISVISLSDHNGWKTALDIVKRKDSVDYGEILYKKGFDVCSALAPLYDIYRR